MKWMMIVAVVSMLAGCASAPTPVARPVPPAPHEKVETTEPAAPPARGADEIVATPSPPGAPDVPVEPKEPGDEVPVVYPADSTEPALAPGDFAMTVESAPPGATVVLDGLPVGRTPCTIVFAGTPRGFFRTETAVRVRFIAGDATEVSATVEEIFTLTDRIPARVVFTTDGARRYW